MVDLSAKDKLLKYDIVWIRTALPRFVSRHMLNNELLTNYIFTLKAFKN